MSALKSLLSQQLADEPFSARGGQRAALALEISWPAEAKQCVLPYIHLLYIQRRNQEIILRFSMAELRIATSTLDLTLKLLDRFRELKIDHIQHGQDLQISVAFARMEEELIDF